MQLLSTKLLFCQKTSKVISKVIGNFITQKLVHTIHEDNHCINVYLLNFDVNDIHLNSEKHKTCNLISRFEFVVFNQVSTNKNQDLSNSMFKTEYLSNCHKQIRQLNSDKTINVIIGLTIIIKLCKGYFVKHRESLFGFYFNKNVEKLRFKQTSLSPQFRNPIVNSSF